MFFILGKIHKLLGALFVNLLIINSLIAQKQANVWYFGSKGGVEFSTGIAQKIPGGEMQSFEGCASYSDENGNLLFYTNGGGTPANSVTGYHDGIIWNSNDDTLHNMMVSEGGGYRAAQSALFLPKPEADSIFYLFTMADNNTVSPTDPEGRGLSYFEIDQRLNNGLGAITIADQRLHTPTFEGMSATIHGNGVDFWVICIDDVTMEFVSFLVTDTGIQGPFFQSSNLGNVNFLERVIKFSPDGKYLCTGRQMYEFDNNTGDLNFLEEITQFNSLCFSFSPESKYLYSLSSFLSGQVIRYDLQATNIDNSREVIDPFPTSFFPGLMQIAPDNNLYFLHQTPSDTDSARVSFAQIRCPDADLPHFDPALFHFDAGEDDVFSGLPNFADHIFDNNPFEIEIGNQGDTLRGCQGEEFILDAIYPEGTYVWSTGDTTQSIIVTEANLYTVEVINTCGEIATDSIWVEILEPPSVIIQSPMGDQMCLRDTFQLIVIAQNSDAILWSTGETTDTILITEPDVYSVTASNTCGSEVVDFEVFKKEDCCQIKYPNAFTPDGDTLNDTFAPYFEDCSFLNYDLKIFSRWGELIFESKDEGVGWDGRVDGKDMSSDVFIWTLNYQLLDKEGDHFSEKGEVTLLR